jgi:hypothetical protein
MNRIGITVALAVALAGCAHKLPPPAPVIHHQALRKVAPGEPAKPAVVAPVPAPVQAAPAAVAPPPKPSLGQRVLNSLVRQRAVK